MKILIVSTSYHPYNLGGGEFSAKYLAESLVKRGYEVVVVAAYNHAEETQYINGVKVIRIKSPNIYWAPKGKVVNWKKPIWHMIELNNYWGLNIFKKILKEEKPDIVHVRNITNFSFRVWKVAKKYGAKVVMTVNNYASVCYKNHMNPNGNNCNDLCNRCKLTAIPKRRLSKYVDAVVGVSKYTLNVHIKNGFFERAIQKVIYTSIQPQERVKHKKQGAGTVFGFIGRIEETKGVSQIIESFGEVKDPNVKLIIAGNGEKNYLEYCKKIASDDDRIQFVGRITQDEFFPLVDFVIINSLWHEPYPRVLVESYSFGKPVVASKRGGTPENILNNKTGLVFDPDAEGELLDKLNIANKKENQEWEEMSKKVLKLVKDNYQNLNDIDQYENIYNKVLKLR